jgi:hypothetical protein
MPFALCALPSALCALRFAVHLLTLVFALCSTLKDAIPSMKLILKDKHKVGACVLSRLPYALFPLPFALCALLSAKTQTAYSPSDQIL